VSWLDYGKGTIQYFFIEKLINRNLKIGLHKYKKLKSKIHTTNIKTNNSFFPRKICISWHKKSKPFLILIKQEIMGGNNISWTACKSTAQLHLTDDR